MFLSFSGKFIKKCSAYFHGVVVGGTVSYLSTNIKFLWVQGRFIDDDDAADVGVFFFFLVSKISVKKSYKSKHFY